MHIKTAIISKKWSGRSRLTWVESFLLGIVLWQGVACSEPTPYVPQSLEPYWPTDVWRTADPRDVGMDLDAVDDVVNLAENADLDSVLIIRRGYLVTEAYFNGFDRSTRHPVYSCTKSVVSTLIGMLIGDGSIGSLELTLPELFPDHEIANLEGDKQRITLEHLLTMTAGLDARDSYLYDWEGLESMHDAVDPLQYVLDLPMADPPGERFEYTNGVSHLLSSLVSETTGQSALQLAQERLFAPIGIEDVARSDDPQGRNWGYARLELRPRDMAKIGYLMLHRGTWDGTDIIDEQWVAAATTAHVDATMVPGYGYHWWVDPNGTFLALGYMGQFIFVSSEHEMVAVTTSSEPDAFEFALELFNRAIIPAIL